MCHDWLNVSGHSLLTILKRKTLSLPLKVETDQFVFCLILPECLSVKICYISPSGYEANRDGSDAESPFPLFFSISASFKNSSPREKVEKLPSFWDWCAVSLFVSIIVPNYNILPRPNNGPSPEKKYSGEAICTLTYTEFDCAALLAMF